MSYAEHIPEDWQRPPDASKETPESPASERVPLGAAFHAISFLAATALAAMLLLPRVVPGAAFGFWQGPLSDPGGVVPVPLISAWLADWISARVSGDRLYLLNLQSAIPAILACGMLASFVAGLFVQIVARPVALVAGVFAAGMLAMNPAFHYAATVANPAPLTLFFAFASLALFHAALEYNRGTLALSAAGGLSGLAAANHPAFGLLLPVLMLWFLLGTRPARGIALPLGAMVLGFAMAAILPLQSAMRAGETIRQFLGHALYTPYPAPGMWPPPGDFFPALQDALPLAVIIPALFALPLFLRRATRPAAFIMLVCFLLLGPFLQCVTNQNQSPMNPFDAETPWLFAMALLSGVAACGTVALAYEILKRLRFGRAALPAGATLAVIYFVIMWPVMPVRDPAFAEELGEALLASAAPSGIVVSGDPLLTSLLLATRAKSASPDAPVIMPVRALADTSGYGQRRLAGLGLLPRHDFLDGKEAERWRHELNLMRSPASNRVDEPLDAYILWDYVSANVGPGPITFVGVQASWLVARGHQSGLSLQYPCVDCPVPADATPPYSAAYTVHDPDGRRTLAALLLPLSENARLQGNAPVARRIADEAVAIAPAWAAPILARLRAEARLGDAGAALASAAVYRSIAPGEGEDIDLEALIAQELARAANEESVRRYLRALDEHPADQKRRDSLLAPLWAAEEFVLLAGVYEALERHYAVDADAVYQLAAVHAQLGHWEEARSLVARWARFAGLPAPEVYPTLRRDGRFAHYLRSLALPDPSIPRT